MMTILKAGYWRIMSLFYANKGAKLHLREIARKASLHGPSTTRFLNNLEEEGLLKSEKDGNQKKYSITRSYKTCVIFQLFDLHKLNSLPTIRQNAIKQFIETLQEKPIIIFMFGSTAKENYKKTSDIDLLLIVNQKINTEKAEEYAEAQTGIKVTALQIPYAKFLDEIKTRRDKVIAAAVSTGYPLTNSIQYYEETLQ